MHGSTLLCYSQSLTVSHDSYLLVSNVSMVCKFNRLQSWGLQHENSCYSTGNVPLRKSSSSYSSATSPRESFPTTSSTAVCTRGVGQRRMSCSSGLEKAMLRSACDSLQPCHFSIPMLPSLGWADFSRVFIVVSSVLSNFSVLEEGVKFYGFT